MTGDIFQQWLIKWDHELRQANRKIMLLVDNFAEHTRLISNIRIERFAPNLTAHVQPLDSSIIRCCKAHYCHHFLHHALDLFADRVDDIYNINQCVLYAQLGKTFQMRQWHTAGITIMQTFFQTMSW